MKNLIKISRSKEVMATLTKVKSLRQACHKLAAHYSDDSLNRTRLFPANTSGLTSFPDN